MGTIQGLPAHILLVHAIVVLLPLTAALLVLCAGWPPARRKFAAANAALSVGVLALVPITTGAGEWLEKRVEPSTLLNEHTELGGTALFVTIPVTALALVVWWRGREADQLAAAVPDRTVPAGSAEPAGAPGAVLTATAPAVTPRRAYLAPTSRKVGTAIIALSVLAAGAAMVDIYKIGDSGARSSWENQFSPTPLPGSTQGD